MSVPSDLRERVLGLPQSDRAELAHDFLLSLEPEGIERDPDHETAWAAEIEERLRKFESGESKAVPADEVMDRLRRIVASGTSFVRLRVLAEAEEEPRAATVRYWKNRSRIERFSLA